MRAARQDGFTLVELLISIVILGAISATLGTSIILGLQTTVNAEQRLTEGNDGRILAEAFIPDVQNATSISTTATVCGGANSRLQLGWTDGTAIVIAYVMRTTGAVRQLVRVRCVGGASTEQVVVRSLVDVTPVVVSCPTGSSDH
ncbi:MAG: prepilin-type N-terminal cleavage/methylation domain-containing protein [Glaciecola sp.]